MNRQLPEGWLILETASQTHDYFWGRDIKMMMMTMLLMMTKMKHNLFQYFFILNENMAIYATGHIEVLWLDQERANMWTTMMPLEL